MTLLPAAPLVVGRCYHGCSSYGAIGGGGAIPVWTLPTATDTRLIYGCLGCCYITVTGPPVGVDCILRLFAGWTFTVVDHIPVYVDYGRVPGYVG